MSNNSVTYVNGVTLTDAAPFQDMNDFTFAGTIPSGATNSGSFQATLTGCTTTPTVTVSWIKFGSFVFLSIPVVTATSNTTGKTLTGMPVGIRPAATASGVIVGVTDNGAVTATPGSMSIATSGVITLYPTSNPSTGWTNANAMGANIVPVFYVAA